MSKLHLTWFPIDIKRHRQRDRQTETASSLEALCAREQLCCSPSNHRHHCHHGTVVSQSSNYPHPSLVSLLVQPVCLRQLLNELRLWCIIFYRASIRTAVQCANAKIAGLKRKTIVKFDGPWNRAVYNVVPLCFFIISHCRSVVVD